MLGNMVHQPLHDVVRLGPAGAAIGIDSRSIRHNTKHPKAGNGNGIIRGERARSGQGRDVGAEIRQPRSHVGVNRNGKRMHLAGLVDHGARLCTVVAAMKVRHETVGTRLLPADTAPEAACRPGDDQLFGMQENLEAEAAADIAGAHPHKVSRHAQRICNLLRDTDRTLRAAPDIEASLFLAGTGDHRAVFHRIDDHPVVDHIDIEQLHPGGFGTGDGGVGRHMVALHPVEGDVARIFVVKLRRAILDRSIDVGDRRHAFIAGVNQFHRILGNAVGLGDDDGHNIAGRAVHITHHRRMRDHGHRLAILVRQAMLALDLTNLVSIEVSLGHDKQHAVHGRGGAGIDRQQPCMRQWRAQKSDTEAGPWLNIIRVTSLTCNQA